MPLLTVWQLNYMLIVGWRLKDWFFIKIIVTFCTGISLPLKLFNSGKLFEVLMVFLSHKQRVFQKAFSQIYALVIFKYVAYHSDLEKKILKIVLAVAASQDVYSSASFLICSPLHV